MSRPTFRQNPTLELLERREVLSGPSADAQYMLELVNLARTNPSAAADRISNSLDANDFATLEYYHVNLQQELQAIKGTAPTQPVAWSDPLAGAALGQSNDQVNLGQQTHTGADGSNLDTRIARTGLKNVHNTGENAFAYSDSVDEAMKAFLVDWGVDSKGHRKNILQPGVDNSSTFNQVGIGIVGTGNKGLGPLVITQDYARVNNGKAFVLGVAYDDPNHTRFYAPGHGRGGVTISATNLYTGAVQSTQTWDAGGYQMNVEPGSYRVQAKINGNVVQSKDVHVGDQNVKVDFNMSDNSATPIQSPPPTQSTPPPAPVQVSTPAPAPVVTNTAYQFQNRQSQKAAAQPQSVTISYSVDELSSVAGSNVPAYASDSGKSVGLNTATYNPLGWITNWSAWKATNASRVIN